jgi:hypothetical protein
VSDRKKLELEAALYGFESPEHGSGGKEGLTREQIAQALQVPARDECLACTPGLGHAMAAGAVDPDAVPRHTCRGY